MLFRSVKTVYAFLQVVDDAKLVKPTEIALNNEAFEQINLPEGANISISLSTPPPSLASRPWCGATRAQ